MATPPPAFASLARQATVLLTTYRRDGTGVGTPVNIAADGGCAFFRTFDRAQEAEHAARLLAAKYRILQGVLVPLAHRVRRYRTLHYELTPGGK